MPQHMDTLNHEAGAAMAAAVAATPAAVVHVALWRLALTCLHVCMKLHNAYAHTAIDDN